MRIGIFFLLLSSLCVGVGVIGILSGAPWLSYVLAWPALAFLLVSLAYGKLGARVLAKREDGTLPILIVLLLLPYFALTWGIWRLIRLGREPCYDRVAPGIYLGRRPIGQELPDDVKLVVDLTAEFPRPPGIRAGCEYLCLPTLDGFIPSEDQGRRLVDKLAAHPGPLYIHCAQGHGRSAVIAGALLVRKGLAVDGVDAERRMKAARPGVSLSASQRTLLQKLAGSNVPTVDG